MENNYKIWCDFLKILPELKKDISALARRSNLSAEAALLLTAVYECPQTDISICVEFKNELLQKGLIEYNEDKLKISGKGAILVKSFSTALQKPKF